MKQRKKDNLLVLGNMHITNKQFAQILTDTADTNTLVTLLTASKLLCKTYGRTVFSDTYFAQIEKVDKNIAAILTALHRAHKASVPQIQSIITYVKQLGKDYRPHFTINAVNKDDTTTLAKKLHKDFADADVDERIHTDDGINIRGEGRYYQRGLDQDLRKIFAQK